MITTAFILGSVTMLGFWMLFIKLPKPIKDWMLKHTLATDIIACVGTYWFHAMFGSGPTVLFAAGFAALYSSIMLAIAKDKELSETIWAIGSKISSFKPMLINLLRSALIKTNNMPTLISAK